MENKNNVFSKQVGPLQKMAQGGYVKRFSEISIS